MVSLDHVQQDINDGGCSDELFIKEMDAQVVLQQALAFEEVSGMKSQESIGMLMLTGIQNSLIRWLGSKELQSRFP